MVLVFDRQMHTIEPSEPEPSSFGGEISIEKL